MVKSLREKLKSIEHKYFPEKKGVEDKTGIIA
jgi:hypothetical protein